MKTLVTVILLFFSTFAHAQELKCSDLLQLEKEFSKKLPLQIDEVTTLVEVSVNCTTKIVKYVRHLSVDGKVLADGFRKRKQRQYLNLHCNNEGLATNGWSVRDYIYDKNLQLLVKLEATPSMCNDS